MMKLKPRLRTRMYRSLPRRGTQQHSSKSMFYSPSPLRVIRKYSLKNLRAYKNHPRHTNLFAKSTKSCHSSSSFAALGALLARSGPPMVRSCISNMSSPLAVVFASVLGVSHDSTLYSSCHPATGFLS
jgi:hypothetical protein